MRHLAAMTGRRTCFRRRLTRLASYNFSVTATASGGTDGGTWTQTTTNYASINYFSGAASVAGNGQTRPASLQPALLQWVVVMADRGQPEGIGHLPTYYTSSS